MTTIKTGIDKISALIMHSGETKNSATKETTKKETIKDRATGSATTTKGTADNETTTKSLFGTRAEDERTALSLGNDVNNIEGLLIEAYRADPKKADATIKKIADALGIPATEREGLTLEGLKRELEIKYQGSVRNLDAFMQLMKNRFEIFKNMISKLDVR